MKRISQEILYDDFFLISDDQWNLIRKERKLMTELLFGNVVVLAEADTTVANCNPYCYGDCQDDCDCYCEIYHTDDADWD